MSPPRQRGTEEEAATIPGQPPLPTALPSMPPSEEAPQPTALQTPRGQSHCSPAGAAEEEPTRSQIPNSRSRSRTPEPLSTVRRSCRRHGGSAVITDIPVDSQSVLIDVAACQTLQQLTSRQAQSVVCHALGQAARNRNGVFYTQQVVLGGQRTILIWQLRLLASRDCRVMRLEVRESSE